MPHSIMKPACVTQSKPTNLELLSLTFEVNFNDRNNSGS